MMNTSSLAGEEHASRSMQNVPDAIYVAGRNNHSLHLTDEETNEGGMGIMLSEGTACKWSAMNSASGLKASLRLHFRPLENIFRFAPTDRSRHSTSIVINEGISQRRRGTRRI